MLVKVTIMVLEVLDNIANFRFGPKFVIGLCAAVGTCTLSVGINEVVYGKSNEYYLGMFLYTAAMIAFALFVYRVGYDAFPWECDRK